MSGYFKCADCKCSVPWEDELPEANELCYPCEIVKLKKEIIQNEKDYVNTEVTADAEIERLRKQVDDWKGMYNVISKRESSHLQIIEEQSRDINQLWEKVNQLESRKVTLE